MDRRPVKTTGMRTMTTLAEERNRRDQEELVARMRAAKMRRRMSAMREGVHRRTHRQTKSAVKTGGKRRRTRRKSRKHNSRRR